MSSGDHNLPQPFTAPPLRGEVLAPGAAVPHPAGPDLPLFPGVPVLLRALRHCWLLATAVGLVVGAAAGTATWFLKPPRYTAFAMLRVASNQPQLLPSERTGGADSWEVYQRTQVALIRSRPVLLAALRNEKVQNLKLVKAQPDPVAWLEEQLKASYVEGTELLRISMSGEEPGDLAALVNAVKDAYLREVVNAERTERVHRLDELEKVCTESENNLRSQREVLHRLTDALKTNNSEAATHKQKIAMDEYASLRTEQARIKAELRTAQVALAVEQAAARPGQEVKVPDSLVETGLDANPLVQQGIAEVLRARQRISDWKSVNTRPVPQALEDQLAAAQAILDKQRAAARADVVDKLRRRIRAEAEVSLSQNQVKIQTLEQQQKEIQAEVEKLKQTADDLGQNTAELDQRRGEIDQDEAILKMVRAEKTRLSMELQSTSQRITAYHDAEVPNRRDIRSQALQAGTLGLFGFLLGGMGVAYRDYRAGRISGRADLGRNLGLKVFGTLPALAGQAKATRLLPLGGRVPDPGLLLRECIDGVRTNLLRDETATPRRLIMVTSAGSKEGKTTLSVHLATSLARSHRRTLLVDGDTRRPSVHRIFDLPLGPGLSQVLRGEADLAAAVRPGPVEGLSVLTAGKADTDGIRGLSARALGDLLDRLRREYDYVIFDSCPVLPVVDSLLVGAHVDGVLLSVRPRVSQLPRVFDACERLGAARVPVLGVVLNGVKGSSYSYEYHYLLNADQ